MTIRSHTDAEIAEVEQRVLDDARQISEDSRRDGTLRSWIRVLSVELEGRYPETQVVVVIRDEHRDEEIPCRYPVWDAADRTESGRPEEAWDSRSFGLVLEEAQ